MPLMLKETKICDLEDQCPGASKDAEEYYASDHPDQPIIERRRPLFENPFRYVDGGDLFLILFFIWLVVCFFL